MLNIFVKTIIPFFQDSLEKIFEIEILTLYEKCLF